MSFILTYFRIDEGSEDEEDEEGFFLLLSVNFLLFILGSIKVPKMRRTKRVNFLLTSVRFLLTFCYLF